MNSSKILLLLSLVFTFASAHDKDIRTIFNDKKVKGTLVLSSFKTHQHYSNDHARASVGYLPASTFKILNTLVALDEKTIKDENEIIKWDGKLRSYKPWNQDHTLKSGFPLSCVWCYQELAGKIGNEKYLSHLKNVNYGNQKTGKALTTFWLDGDIRISAMEQIGFLEKVYTSDLPYKEEHVQILRDIMLVEKTPEYTIRAKTGWSGDIGWYVGYVETKGDVWFFALNMDIKNKSQLKYRVEIVMEALKAKKII